MVLPETFPEPRAKVTRAEKAATKAQKKAEQAAENAEPAEEAEGNQEASTMEISYNVTGPRRKELATAVGNFIRTAPVYQTRVLTLDEQEKFLAAAGPAIRMPVTRNFKFMTFLYFFMI